MTHLAKYQQTNSWKDKIMIMKFYHISSKSTIKQTAAYFRVSVGLVSENLHLADNLEDIINCKTRQEALSKLKE